MNDDIDDDTSQREADELRALWSALPAPRAGVDADGLPSVDVAASDDLTRAAVERLRAAWAAHVVEVPGVPFELRRAHAARKAHAVPRARRTRSTTLRWVVALAGAAAATLLVFALRAEREPRAPESRVVGAVATVVGDSVPYVDAHGARSVERSVVPPASVAALVEIPRGDFKLRADGFEFESQGVRFVLIETTGEAPSSTPDPKE